MSFFPNPDFVSMLSATGQWDALRAYLSCGSGHEGLSASAPPFYPSEKRSLGIVWKNIIFVPFAEKPKKAPHSKHPLVFKTFKMEYEEYPERFTLASEGHHDRDGRYYFSIKYNREDGKGGYLRANFHIYGRTEGYKFICESADILMGPHEIYRDAVVY